MDGSDGRPSAKIIALIADILQVPASFFLDDEGEEPVLHGIDDQRAEVVRLFDALPGDADRLQFITLMRTFTRLAICRASRSPGVSS